MANATGNQEYKSDVFGMLMQDKRRALEVYNAVNGTAYDDPEAVEMTTLDNRSFSLTMRNDASFILDANLNLYEHQSTICPNMPLRDLLYFSSIIQKKIDRQKRDIYGRRLLQIPVPRFVVFYNGLEDAIRLAIGQCIEENVLKDFLQERREEVTRVMTLDFTFERRLELQTAEAAEEGRIEGEKAGRIETLRNMIRKKLIKHKSLELIADELEETPEAIRPLYEQVQKELEQNS